MLVAFDDSQRIRVEAGGGHRVADPADAFALHLKRRRAQAFGVDQALVPISQQPHGEQPDLAMPQTDHVVGHLAHRRPVVDTHLRRSGYVLGLVDHHQRQAPLQHHLKIWVVAGRRVDHEAVDARGKHRRGPVGDAAARAHRHQQQPLPARFARLCKSRNEIQRCGIAEGIREGLGDHQADSTCPASSQRSGDRVGAGVAQSFGGGEHTFAQRVRQLIRPVVGVRDGGPGDLELSRQRCQGRPASRQGAHEL